MAADHRGKLRFTRSDETESSLVELAELAGSGPDEGSEEGSAAPTPKPPVDEASGERVAAPVPGAGDGDQGDRAARPTAPGGGDDDENRPAQGPGSGADLRQLGLQFAALGARFDPAQRGAPRPEQGAEGPGGPAAAEAAPKSAPDGHEDAEGPEADIVAYPVGRRDRQSPEETMTTEQAPAVERAGDRRRGFFGRLRKGPSGEPPRRRRKRRLRGKSRQDAARALPREAPDEAMAADAAGLADVAAAPTAPEMSTVVDEAEPPLTDWSAQSIDRLFRDGGDRVEAVEFAQALAEDIAAGRFHVSHESCAQRSPPVETSADGQLYRRAGGEGAEAMLKYRAAKWLLARGATGVDFDLQVYPPDQETADVIGYSVQVLVECGGTAPSKVARALGLTSWTTFAFLPYRGERIYLFKATVDGERAVRFRYGRAYLERVRAAVTEARAEGLEADKVNHRAAEIVSEHWTGISWFEACAAVERVRRYARLRAHRRAPPPAPPAPPFPQA